MENPTPHMLPQRDRRVLSLWFPRLGIDLARRKGALPPDSPCALILDMGGRVMLTAVDEGGVDAEAERAGAAIGMTLADARAIVPELVARPADPEGEAAALDRLADWAWRYTPLVATDGTDGLILDVTGCAHLLGGEAGLIRDALARLARSGLSARAALADNPAAAWAMARFASPRREGFIIVPPGESRAALDPLPVSATRLPTETLARLTAVGLRRIGDLPPIPRAALVRRFGAATADRLDRLWGRAPDPLVWTRPTPEHVARQSMVDPITTAEAIAAVTRRLLAVLCEGLERAGMGARRVALTARRVDQPADEPAQRLVIGTNRPVRAPDSLFRLLAERLERLEPGPGFEFIALTAEETGAFRSGQSALNHPDMPGLAAEDAAEGLADLADRLDARLGAGATLRPAPRGSWLPERAVVAGPVMEAPPVGPSWPAERLRPTRLLVPPELITVMAPAPDDPPLSFRWRGVTHRVARADGPERIEPEWWRNGEHMEHRDYYRVEDVDGGRFWVFRAGPYGGDEPPRWFLHGLFG